MTIRKTAWLTLAAVTSLCHGCATSKLWEADHFATCGEPAPQAHLVLRQSPSRGDVLVEYDELAPGRDQVQRRAYFLNQNEGRMQSGQKPRFVVGQSMEALRPIPVVSQPPNLGGPLPTDLYAVASEDGHQFTLFSQNQTLGPAHDLPVYRASSGRWIQVLLTPPAVLADATLVGGFLVILWWPAGLDVEL